MLGRTGTYSRSSVYVSCFLPFDYFVFLYVFSLTVRVFNCFIQTYDILQGHAQRVMICWKQQKQHQYMLTNALLFSFNPSLIQDFSSSVYLLAFCGLCIDKPCSWDDSITDRPVLCVASLDRLEHRISGNSQQTSVKQHRNLTHTNLFTSRICRLLSWWIITCPGDNLFSEITLCTMKTCLSNILFSPKGSNPVFPDQTSDCLVHRKRNHVLFQTVLW